MCVYSMIYFSATFSRYLCENVSCIFANSDDANVDNKSLLLIVINSYAVPVC